MSLQDIPIDWSIAQKDGCQMMNAQTRIFGWRERKKEERYLMRRVKCKDREMNEEREEKGKKRKKGKKMEEKGRRG